MESFNFQKNEENILDQEKEIDSITVPSLEYQKEKTENLDVQKKVEIEIYEIKLDILNSLSENYSGDNILTLKINKQRIERRLRKTTDDLYKNHIDIAQKYADMLFETETNFKEKVDHIVWTLFSQEMNTLQINNDNVENLKNVEQSANCQEDMTNLMLERIQNPVIHDQVINLLYLIKKYDISDVNQLHIDEIRQVVDKRVKEVSNDTPISFDKDVVPNAQGRREIMPLFYEPALAQGEIYGDFQKNVLEAHEKGHVIRKIRQSPLADKYFQRCLDYTQIKYTASEIDEINTGIVRLYGEKYKLSEQEIKERAVEYLGAAIEIIERMSQLKNYFGMKGNEIFTKAHLDYARIHYIEDTKMNNDMKELFQAITPETEDVFLEYINKAGI